jgi:hypothetical protein
MYGGRKEKKKFFSDQEATKITPLFGVGSEKTSICEKF